MDRLYCLLAVLSALALFVMSEAVSIQTNVDTEEPSVIRSPDLGKEDVFGWTAVLHQLQPVLGTDTLEESLMKTRIVIGAPKGTYPGGLNLPDPGLPAENNTGLVYSCQVVGSSRCEGVTGNTQLYLPPDAASEDITNGVQAIGRPDGEIGGFFLSALSEGRLFDQAPNTRLANNDFDFERKSGQLMGSSLATNGQNVVACAPSWSTTLTGDATRADVRGVCFVGSMNLSNFQSNLPCSLLGNSNTATDSGYCLGGFSALIVNQRLALGAPGERSFSGSVYSRMIDTAEFGGDFFSFDRGGNISLLFGWTTADGYVTSNVRTAGISDVLVSTPRFDGSSYTGRVEVFDAVMFLPSMNMPFPPASNILIGMQVAEFFGYSVATCDITGDGYDEVLVGAPMYSSVDTRLIPEIGRLYIFANVEGTLNTTNPVILQGTSRYGRFGFSVTNLGDLNSDGYEDFAVGAPYEASTTSSNTGVVYVYYGRDSVADILMQVPQMIYADDIVESVSSMTQLRSFGFFISGNFDLDKNLHSDFMVGAPDDQAVVILRTLPVIDVTVDFLDVPAVDLDTISSFNVTIQATYVSIVPGPAVVSFQLIESRVQGLSRISFSRSDQSDVIGEGTLVFTETSGMETDTKLFRGTSTETTIEVFPIVSTINDNYTLALELIDVERVLEPVSGEQPLSDLNPFPRYRLFGESELMVSIIDPCQITGCISDVVLMPLAPSVASITAGFTTSQEFDITYTNIGTQQGRALVLVIYDVPDLLFDVVSLSGSSGSFDCSPQPTARSEFTNVTCILLARLVPGSVQRATLALNLNGSHTLIGDEDDFNISLEILVDSMGVSTDKNQANNQQSIPFSIVSDSDINVGDMSFQGAALEYATNQAAAGITNLTSLGGRTRLEFTVGNSGPTTIQSARLTVKFPSQLSDITGNRYFLYPATLGATYLAPTTVDCVLTGFDPDNLDRGAPTLQVTVGRRRRSITQRSPRHVLQSRGEMQRTKRQENSVTLDCRDASTCLDVSCNIEQLSTQGVRFSLGAFVDQRFFGANGESRDFELIATASVVVTSSFQSADGSQSDNEEIATAMLSPRAPDEGSGSLVHVILWPAIGGVLILVVLVVLLYFLGFFRRKKKPEEGEVEGGPTITEVPSDKQDKQNVGEGTMM